MNHESEFIYKIVSIFKNFLISYFLLYEPSYFPFYARFYNKNHYKFRSKKL